MKCDQALAAVASMQEGLHTCRCKHICLQDGWDSDISLQQLAQQHTLLRQHWRDLEASCALVNTREAAVKQVKPSNSS
jgi:hypothetical protein